MLSAKLNYQNNMRLIHFQFSQLHIIDALISPGLWYYCTSYVEKTNTLCTEKCLALCPGRGEGGGRWGDRRRQRGKIILRVTVST